MKINRFTPLRPGVFRGSAEEALVWHVRPDRPARWFELIHFEHVHHNGKCLKNRFGTKCKEEVSNGDAE